MEDALTTGQTARLLELSDERVRQMWREGKLAGQQTPLGLLFSRKDVERLVGERAAAKAAKEASA